MKEKWIEYGKKADFKAWANELRVSPLVARLLVNRGVKTVEEAFRFLYGGRKDLSNPHMMKDLDKAVSVLTDAMKKNEAIAIVNDYDCDGIFAGQILYEGLKECRAKVGLYTPNRRNEGYGINKRIIDEAYSDGYSVILTCDNGISAREEVTYAKGLGFRVIVTDHHEVPFTTENGEKKYLIPDADAVVDPKQEDCRYPFPSLCGAGVAFRLMEVLYSSCGIPVGKTDEFYEYVGIATIADMVDLTGENRILAKLGLEALKKTGKVPFRALYDVCGISAENMTSYHVGYIIAPCFNAVGRLNDVSLVHRFLRTADEIKAVELASHIHAMNEERKAKTEEDYQRALSVLSEEHFRSERVWLIPVPEAESSVVGIVAGRIKEKFYHPVFVLTDNGDGMYRASGRSIPGYGMSDELNHCRDLLEQFGGHAMAAGLSVKKENLEALRIRLNERCTLTEDEMIPRVNIDARAPLSYMTETFVNEIRILEPFGAGNPKPLFAAPHFHLTALRVLGQNKNVLRMTLSDETGTNTEAMWFDDPETVYEAIRESAGEEMLTALLKNEKADVDIAFSFAPDLHEYRSVKSIQLLCRNCCYFPVK